MNLFARNKDRERIATLETRIQHMEAAATDQSSKRSAASQEMIGRALDWFRSYVPPANMAIQYLDDLIQRKGIAIYREMPLRNESIASGLRLLKYATLSNDLCVSAASDDPEDEKAAAHVEDCIDRLEINSMPRVLEFAQDDSDQVGWCTIVQDWSEPEEWEGMHVQRINCMRPLPVETIAKSQDDYGRTTAILQSKSRQMVLPGWDPSYFDTLDPFRIVDWSWQRNGAHAYGVSLQRPIYRWYNASEKVLLDLLRYLEFFGLPITELALPGNPSEEAMDEALERTKRMMGGQTFISTNAAKYTLHETTHTSTAAFSDALTMFNRNIARGLMQPALLMEGEGGGSYAAAKTGKSVYTWVIDHRRRCIEREILQDQFARRLLKVNFPNGDRMKCPSIYFEEFEPRDLTIIISMLEAAKRMGVTFSKSFARMMMGIEAPDTDESEDELIGMEPEPDVVIPAQGKPSEDFSDPEWDQFVQELVSARCTEEAGEVVGGNGKLSGPYVRNAMGVMG